MIRINNFISYLLFHYYYYFFCSLQLQLLHSELDRTQGNCRDMLLSQGAELTMISMHLSQMSMNIHTLLTTAAEFAANELSLQKEVIAFFILHFRFSMLILIAI